MDNAPQHVWQLLHPPVQNHAHGWLNVGDGHEIYWETSGHPGGAAALFVHGGPGAGSQPEDRRWFDPQRWRIVLFDQRGAGRSRPAGGLMHNTTAHLVRDMEALRQHLGIERWLLLGGSWGATLALAYAKAYPRRVLALVLRGVFTATKREWSWLYAADGAALLHPAAWQAFIAVLPTPLKGSVPAAFVHELQHADSTRRSAATRAWLGWEQALMAAESRAAEAGERPAQAKREHEHTNEHEHEREHPPPSADEHAQARIGAHYAQHGFFIDGQALIVGAASLQGIPASIVHGLLDGVTPVATALALQAAWPAAKLHRVEKAGHASGQPALAQALLAAIEQSHPDRPHRGDKP